MLYGLISSFKSTVYSFFKSFYKMCNYKTSVFLECLSKYALKFYISFSFIVSYYSLYVSNDSLILKISFHIKYNTFS